MRRPCRRWRPRWAHCWARSASTRTRLGFWAAVFASLLGVWQSVPYIYADFYGVVKRVSIEERRALTKVTSMPYRAALVFITLAPLPFAFVGRPLFIIVAYTIVGSLFIPFLAATLLYLNNRVEWKASIPRNHWTTNVVLVGDPRDVPRRRRARSRQRALLTIFGSAVGRRLTGSARCSRLYVEG